MDGSSTPLPPSSAALSLSTALREGSRGEHQAAESSPFVSDLVAGRAPGWRYAAYVRRLRDVYAALESAVHEHRHHPAVAAVHDTSLVRSPALEADLEHWSPGAVGAALTSPAAAAYRASIGAAGRRPHLLVAHHYTRYLGDLSGGRILADALRRGYAEHGLEHGGLAFYDFVDIPTPVPYKRAYRERLDAIELSARERADVVDEARHAFRLNRAVFVEVAALVGPESG